MSWCVERKIMFVLFGMPPSSFLNHLFTNIVQLNVTLIQIGFQRPIVITEMTH